MSNLTWHNATIIDIKNETPTTKRFFFKIADLQVFNFKPGQFITMDLPIHEKKNKRWRSYSIASAPNNTNIFELIIVYLEGGAGTNFLFNQTQIGDTIVLRGPAGVFTLPDTIEKDLYFICTGTGIAPFRAMIHHCLNHHIPFKNIHLIFGCRKKGDVLYQQEFFDLMQKHPNIYYHPCLSREDEVPQGFYKGYVHQVYQNLLSPAGESNVSPKAAFYICGWKNMIDEARKNLTELGFTKHDIHFELYG